MTHTCWAAAPACSLSPLPCPRPLLPPCPLPLCTTYLSPPPCPPSPLALPSHPLPPQTPPNPGALRRQASLCSTTPPGAASTGPAWARRMTAASWWLFRRSTAAPPRPPHPSLRSGPAQSLNSISSAMPRSVRTGSSRSAPRTWPCRVTRKSLATRTSLAMAPLRRQRRASSWCTGGQSLPAASPTRSLAARAPRLRAGCRRRCSTVAASGSSRGTHLTQQPQPRRARRRQV
mmetsp:Transcript_19493/g.57778  ORF Transcript_19493/g.57778 Transcript_19493/m.57778 type:complete len:232 (-) Transcript_19493:396-1091(-)